MCNQQGAGEHGAPSHYLYQENNSVPGTRPGCLLVGGVGRCGGGGGDEAESGGLDCHPGGSNPRSKVQPSDHLPALVSLPTPTRGGARSKRCNPEEPEPCASEPRKRGARRGVLSTRHPPPGTVPAAGSPPRGLASRAAAEPGQRSAGLSPWGAVTGGRTPRRTWRRERGWARRARSPGNGARPGRPGARRRARVLPPGPRGRGSAAGGGGPSSAAGVAGQAVPVPQHCCAAESACHRLAAPAAQATWSAFAQWGPGEGASRGVGSELPPSGRDPCWALTAGSPGLGVLI